ncbi:type II toxin-antitoxin system RelE/ParE family toxin [Bradyrhizobium sp. 157]|nr:type II toxin-antitoxin system RelE/ParE family toxin [Bradyrhizobium sp. 157]
MRLRYAPRARADIAEIHEYISQHSPRAASAVVNQIRITGRLIAEHPGVGRETDIPGVRVLPTARYSLLVYYHILGDDLVVVHVRHGRRDTPGADEF